MGRGVLGVQGQAAAQGFGRVGTAEARQALAERPLVGRLGGQEPGGALEGDQGGLLVASSQGEQPELVLRLRVVGHRGDDLAQAIDRLTETEFLPGALVIGIKYAECFNTDPLLPPELLPRPWPGRRARDLLQRSRQLGILLREEHNKPQLFAPFDDILDTL